MREDRVTLPTHHSEWLVTYIFHKLFHSCSLVIYLVFPLPVGPMIAFSPGFIIPLKREKEVRERIRTSGHNAHKKGIKIK